MKAAKPPKVVAIEEASQHLHSASIPYPIESEGDQPKICRGLGTGDRLADLLSAK